MKKSSKIKIKKIRLPLKKMTEKEKNYVAVVLEDVNHNFKIFGEVLEDVKKKGEITFEEVGRINERLTSVEMSQSLMQEDIIIMKGDITTMKGDIITMKGDIIIMKGDITTMKGDIITMKGDIITIKGDITTMKGDIKGLKITTARIEKEIILIKNEIKDLRMSLSKKADIERLENIELRVVQIEKHLGLSPI